MTKDEALKIAGYDLDGVIVDVERFDGFDDVCLKTIKRVRSTIAEALEQPAQEPVAWMLDGHNLVEFEKAEYHDNYEWTPLYTNPHQWQGLTDDDMSIIFDKFDWKEIEIAGEHLDLFKFSHAIEQALRIKNDYKS